VRLEIADYATYDGTTVMFEVMGVGLPEEETPFLLLPGMLSAAWGVTIRQLAAGLGVEIDEIAEFSERASRRWSLPNRASGQRSTCHWWQATVSRLPPVD